MRRIIEINIDEIALQGFQTKDAEGIKKVVESGLITLIRDKGYPGTISSDNKIGSIDAGRFSMASGSTTGTIGNQIAAAVFNGIKNNTNKTRK